MKYYESHEDAYKKIKKNNLSSWDEFGFLIEYIEMHKDEDIEYMADFRAICRKPMSD